MQKETHFFSVYKRTVMTKATSNPKSASQIYYDIVPVLYLREDKEPGLHYSVSGFLPKDMGPVELRSTFTTHQSLRLVA